MGERVRKWWLIGLAALAMAGCGEVETTTSGETPASTESTTEQTSTPSLSTATTTTESTPPDEVETPRNESAPEEYSGKAASVFQSAKDLCGVFPPKQIAREYGVDTPASHLEIAQAYAEQSYVDTLVTPGRDGCLAGLG